MELEDCMYLLGFKAIFVSQVRGKNRQLLNVLKTLATYKKIWLMPAKNKDTTFHTKTGNFAIQKSIYKITSKSCKNSQKLLKHRLNINSTYVYFFQHTQYVQSTTVSMLKKVPPPTQSESNKYLRIGLVCELNAVKQFYLFFYQSKIVESLRPIHHVLSIKAVLYAVSQRKPVR